MELNGTLILVALWGSVAFFYFPVVFPIVSGVVIDCVRNYYFPVVSRLPVIAIWFTVIFVIAKLAIGEKIKINSPVAIDRGEPEAVKREINTPQKTSPACCWPTPNQA